MELKDGIKTYSAKSQKEWREWLQKAKNVADSEIEKLKALRKVLIEKNLNGTYSDDILKNKTQ
jgi:triphosphoribosyl-dephospho-CoA synthetase